MQLIRNGWHMQTINNKQTCALSQFYDWLIRRNIRVIDSWLLLSPPAGGGSAAWWWLRPVLRRLCVTERLVSGYSLLLPPSPPTLSRIMDHKTALTRARAAGGWRGAWTPFDHRVMWPVNSWWTCSDARISANTTVADMIRYDTPSIGSDTILIR